jgi:hypothetical protein
MRATIHRQLRVGAFLVALAAGCQPLLVNDGHFWTGAPDSGSHAGSGGAAGSDIGGSGTGGSDGTVGGTGGVEGLGGTTGSGGRTATGGRTGAGGADAGLGGATGSGGGSGVLTGTLTVAVTTRSAGGRYEPDNVGAIWIADSGSRFVKSLFVWGSQRRRELTTWTSATAAAGVANNVVDAVTAATMSGHGVRMATWNGTDPRKVLVPDGAYKVCFELRDGSGQSQCVDFMKTRSPQTLSPADTTTFTKRAIGYAP